MYGFYRTMKRVAVIGAGPGGLAVLRHLSTKPELYSLKAYEKSSTIGGQWNYSDASGKDENGLPVHSSIYRNLRVNGPTDCIKYTDFPYRNDIPALCRHEEVRRYIEDYANHFELKKFVQFDTIVTKIQPVEKSKHHVVWQVSVKNVQNIDGNAVMEVFDAVVIAAGVFAAPNVPDIPGLNEFNGKVIHSFDYRVPEVFADMRVAVVGGCISGQDIAVDVSKSAREVLFSTHMDPLAWDIPKHIRQCVDIERLTKNTAIMKDGSEHEIDAIIFGTGYRKHLPFLSPECRIRIEEDRIIPLYKHIIHTELPSLAFIGYNQIDFPFNNCEIQTKFLMAAWEGRYKLPSTDEMNADTDRDLEIRRTLDMPASKGHHLSFLMRSYQDELARLGGFEPLSRRHYDVFEVIMEILITGLTFKDYDFERDETGEIDLERFKEFFINEQKKSTCGMEEIQRRLKKIKRPQ